MAYIANGRLVLSKKEDREKIVKVLKLAKITFAEKYNSVYGTIYYQL